MRGRGKAKDKGRTEDKAIAIVAEVGHRTKQVRGRYAKQHKGEGMAKNKPG